MNNTIKIKSCTSCPFSSWSDHAYGYGKNGTVCVISDIIIQFNSDLNHYTNEKDYVHKDCPLHVEDYIKTYTLK